MSEDNKGNEETQEGNPSIKVMDPGEENYENDTGYKFSIPHGPFSQLWSAMISMSRVFLHYIVASVDVSKSNSVKSPSKNDSSEPHQPNYDSGRKNKGALLFL